MKVYNNNKNLTPHVLSRTRGQSQLDFKGRSQIQFSNSKATLRQDTEPDYASNDNYQSRNNLVMLPKQRSQFIKCLEETQSELQNMLPTID